MRLNLSFSNNISEIINEYSINDDPFCEDDELIIKIKHIIFTKLSEIERRVLLLYVEYASIRKVANILNISPSTTYNYITSIKNKIINALK